MFASNPKQPNNDASNCKSDYRACKDNKDLINNYDPSVIRVAKSSCKLSVDEHVKFGSPEWDWNDFGSFLIGNDFVKTGIIIIADNNVKIENMYGAKARTEVRCSYDLESKKVLEVMVDGEFIIISIKPTADTPSVAGKTVINELGKDHSDAKVNSVTEVNTSSNESTEKIDSSTNTQNSATPTPQVDSVDAKKEKLNSDTLISSDRELSKNQDAQQHFYVQIGIFSDEANVKQLQDKLVDLGYKSQTEVIDTAKGKKIRLSTQEFNDRNEASVALQSIKDAGLSGMVVSQ